MEKKIVEMKQENKETKAKDNKQPLSYEQLNNICSQLYQENQKLVQQLNQLNMANMFKNCKSRYRKLGPMLRGVGQQY